jgi:cyclase
VTLARRVIPVVDVTSDGAPARAFERGGLEVPHFEAICTYHVNDGADELWLRLITPDARGAGGLFEPLNALRERAFVPVVAWGAVGSAADARLLVGLGAERVIIDVLPEPGLDPVALVGEAADAVGPDRVGAAILVRRVMSARRVVWELCDREGKGTGQDAVTAAGALAAAGAGEIVVVARYTPAEGAPRTAHDADFVDAMLPSLKVPVVSVGDDREPADMAAPLLIGADAAASATLFADGTVSVQRAKQILADFGIPLRPAEPPYSI